MGGRLPRLTAVEFLRVLHRDSWVEHRQVGSHVQLKHSTKPGRVTVARHAGVILKPKTLLTALEQAGLSVDDLERLR
ncbi:MAG TPA: type II toxin-antitoxin system HicA family toxin [Polyangia bacterium]|jgi:predicted RNA binding protein YcfA (HicA-like mRNA interferase family)|nr:type II toxin-antitoxin system HicA family toxin [Polyangia bacterium]